jgi:hypothetical protein
MTPLGMLLKPLGKIPILNWWELPLSLLKKEKKPLKSLKKWKTNKFIKNWDWKELTNITKEKETKNPKMLEIKKIDHNIIIK